MDDASYRIQELKLRLRALELDTKKLRLRMASHRRQLIDLFSTVIEAKKLGGKPISHEDLEAFTRAPHRLKARQRRHQDDGEYIRSKP